jgi:sialate O-acetylesterase
MNQRQFSSILLLFLLVFNACTPSEQANLKLNSLFSDHMVLQQKEAVAFWGTYTPKEKITVRGSWGSESTCVADDNGHWKLTIPTPKAGGPYEVNVVTKSTIHLIKDVLIGEVWLASGQSNMEMDFDYCCNTTDFSEYERSTANYSNIRMVTVKKQLSSTPVQDFEGRWEKAVGDSITPFSAAAYFFAKRLHKELNVPIGIIHSSWGGTDVEAWTSREQLSTLDFMDDTMNAYDTLIEDSTKSYNWFSQFESIKSPSDVWYLFLEDPLGVPEKWKELDFKDDRHITSDDTNYENWKQIDLPGSIDNIFETNDFDGVILLRKSFIIDEIKGDYSLQLGAVSDMDFTYVNGKQIGSSMGKLSGETKIYTIPKSVLKMGENNIIIRVVNQYKEGKVGDVSLLHSENAAVSLAGKWNYRVSAEAYKSIYSYSWPYIDFYFYDNESIDFSKRPPVTNYNQDSKSSLFNGMISPLVPYTIKGAIWYQGENNVSRFKEYERLFPALISDWRNQWSSNFPFYFVQIAPFEYRNGLSPSLRDAQRKTLKLPNTGMVVTLDIGENNDIHPSNKHDVGYRLAGLALANDYGKSIVASGPLFRSQIIDGNKLILEFDFVGSGLMTPTTKLKEFEIAGADKNYMPAVAKIIGKEVHVYSASIPNPKFSRYAWRDTSNASLFNKEGLPASSFTTE